jgi:hypothetical protein
VDAFVLARLEKAGIAPSPPLNKLALLRRVTLDLTGLPPSPEEVHRFMQDRRTDAFAHAVDRLLASPHYGERWAQHWLDIVRYAESNGYELDAERPHAWHFRDYIIQAFNADKPYDRFITEQLAGDFLGKGLDPKQHSDLWIATGLNRCGQIHLVSGNTDPEENRQEVLTEMTGAVGSVFLGLTIGCARCHDHKFDPITQKEYYQLQAFFAAARLTDIDIAGAQEKAQWEKRNKELQTQLTPVRKQVSDLDDPYKTLLTELKRASLDKEYRDALDIEPKKRTPVQKKLAENAQILIKVTWDEIVEAMTAEERARRSEWRARIHVLEAQLPALPPNAWAITEDEKIPATHILKRGDPKRKGKEVTPGFPNCLTDVALPATTHHSPLTTQQQPLTILDSPTTTDHFLTRLSLARWLSQPDHPLTARVMVNRIWQHHFGQGLVRTPNDFGVRGVPPTHPELLDWLAAEFVASGWSIKHMHRLMVLSSTYQQASRVALSQEINKLDPDNRLLWRMNRRRLEGETLRDTILAAAGTFNPKLGGPMVRVPLEQDVIDLIFTEGEPDGLWHVSPDPGEYTRRSIYLFTKRNVRLPLFEAFDQPDLLNSCPVRSVSTFAPQALILLNGPFTQEQSRAYALQLLRACGPDRDRQIESAYERALGRPARPAELHQAREFLTGQTALLRERLRSRQRIELPPDLPVGVDPAAAAALADFCLAMFNRNEFLYVD